MIDSWVDLGREVVAEGRLEHLRQRLGLNRNSMAAFLQTTMAIYTAWERQRSTTLRASTANRIGRFYHLAQRQLELLEDDGVDLKHLIPLHHAITHLGVPQELMLKMYRRGDFEAEDLGILGLWLYEEDLDKIRDLL